MSRSTRSTRNGIVHPGARLAFLLLLAASLSSSLLAQISARVCASREQVLAATGTTDVKVVFIRTRLDESISHTEVYFVDFSQTSPAIQKLNGMTDTYFPVISPDGQRITYQTMCADEGWVPGGNCPSSIWIRPLAAEATPTKICDDGYVPRFVDSTADGQPAVIYATSVVCPLDSLKPWAPAKTSICWLDGKTVMRSIVGGTSVQPEQVVFAHGAYYGGMSYDHRYLCTAWPAGPNPFMIDVQGSSTTPQAMHIFPVRNKITGVDSTYVRGCCNPSRSPSRIFTSAMMYYDFGFRSSKYVHPVYGNWAQHQYFFISRMSSGAYGEIIRAYSLPTDQPTFTTADSIVKTGMGMPVGSSWLNPEWSSHPYFAAAALQLDRLFILKAKKPDGTDTAWWDHTYNQEGIYLVNLKDRTALRLVTTADTSYASTTSFDNPYVWVKMPPCSQEDPSWLASVDPDTAHLPIAEVAPVMLPGVDPNSGVRERTNPLGSTGVFCRVTVFSSQGRAVWQASGADVHYVNGSVAIPSMKPGLYFARIEAAGVSPKTLRWVVR